jgi:hypothetical protein
MLTNLKAGPSRVSRAEEEDEGLRSIGKRHEVLQVAIHIAGELYYGCGLRVDGWRRWFAALALAGSTRLEALPPSFLFLGMSRANVMMTATDLSITDACEARRRRARREVVAEHACRWSIVIYCLVDSSDK